MTVSLATALKNMLMKTFLCESTSYVLEMQCLIQHTQSDKQSPIYRCFTIILQIHFLRVFHPPMSYLLGRRKMNHQNELELPKMPKTQHVFLLISSSNFLTLRRTHMAWTATLNTEKKELCMTAYNLKPIFPFESEMMHRPTRTR